MKLDAISTAVERGGNFTEKTFTIKADAKMFNLLSDKIYADKPGAVVREIASNAKDAHVIAGKQSIPFDIHLPNVIYPYFSVRDYGNGMSHQEMFDIYTTYSESTKTTTNTQIGAFGVGAKSPFAYTDSFTIVSRTNTSKNTYTAYIGDEGIPVLALLTQETIDGSPGIEVIVPVKTSDFSVFETRVFDLLRYFTPIPNILGIDHDRVKFQTPSYKHSGDGWGLRHDRLPSRAVQGGVYYPINFSAVYKDGTPLGVDRFINTHAIDLYFNMNDNDNERGCLDVSLSREALSYDPYTCTQIKQAVDHAYASLLTQIQHKVANADTFWNACVVYSQVPDLFGTMITMNWRGKPASILIQIDEPELKTFDVEVKSFSRGILRGKRGRVLHGIECNPNNVTVWLNDINRGAATRIITLMKNKGGNHYVITPHKRDYKAHFEKLVARLGNPEINLISSLPAAASSARIYNTKTTPASEIACLKLNEGRYGSMKESWTADSVPLNTPSYYVLIDRYHAVTTRGNQMTDTKRFVKVLKELKMIGNYTPVYGVGKRVLKTLTTKPNKWINLMDFVNEQLSQPQFSDAWVQHFVYNKLIQRIQYKPKYAALHSLVERAATHKDSDLVKKLAKLTTDTMFGSLLERVLDICDKNNMVASRLLREVRTQAAIDIDTAHTDAVLSANVDQVIKMWDDIITKCDVIEFVDMSRITQPQFINSITTLIKSKELPL